MKKQRILNYIKKHFFQRQKVGREWRIGKIIYKEFLRYNGNNKEVSVVIRSDLAAGTIREATVDEVLKFCTKKYERMF